jgi:beta-1,4-mannosyltransferase
LKRIYLYPISSRHSKIVLYNPYIDDLASAIEKYYNVINKHNPSDKGIFDFIRYIFKTDYLFLNWIENLPERKGGKYQTWFFFAILPLLKLLGIKIIWTMHNKLSHSKNHLAVKQSIFNKLLQKSDVILTHSSEGISYAESIVPGIHSRLQYFAHPVKDRRGELRAENTRDILIWGTLSPYKGILEFLKLLHEQNLQNKYKILIIGKSISKDYFNSLLDYSNENILIREDFVDSKALQELISQSKIVLFTYATSSILSSGALMDSIGFGATAIGPEVGAFNDLAKEGIITTYKNQDDIISVINNQPNGNRTIPENNMDTFLKENSWNKYAENVHNLLQKF